MLGMLDIDHSLPTAFLERQFEGCPSKRLSFGGVTIKYFGNLFQSPTLCLWEKKVNGGDHGRQSANVHKVELPGNGFQSDGIAELVEANTTSAFGVRHEDVREVVGRTSQLQRLLSN